MKNVENAPQYQMCGKIEFLMQSIYLISMQLYFVFKKL